MLDGDFKRASAVFEETLELDRKLPDKGGETYSLGNLGWAILHQGDHERAQRFFEETLELSGEIGHKVSLAESLEGMAGVAAAREDAERTARLWGRPRSCAKR